MRLPLLDNYLREQSDLTAVERFSRRHDELLDRARPDQDNKAEPAGDPHIYRELIPVTTPRKGEQLSFHVDLDRCTGCKARATASTLLSIELLGTGRSFRLVQQELEGLGLDSNEALEGALDGARVHREIQALQPAADAERHAPFVALLIAAWLLGGTLLWQLLG